MSDATFACPDLTTFCRLDELRLEVTGQRFEPKRAVLACFVLPALGLSGLGLKDIWGYCMTAMVVLMFICGTIFLLVPVFGW